MNYDFDKIIDRKNTDSVKFDTWQKNDMPYDVLPMWVADMDFKAPKAVTRALHEVCEQSIYGYTFMGDECFDAIRNWFLKRHGWAVERNWMVQTPGVVFALAACVRAYTEPGDSVLIQQPVYYPFGEVVIDNGRNLVVNELINNDSHYKMDFDDLEKKLKAPETKLMILCSPHNPVGRVWTSDELSKVASLCIKYKVVLVCDEIHCDLVHEGNKHVPIASIDDEIAANCIVCTSPSKTFNLAGLQVSNIFIADKQKRRAFKDELKKTGIFGINMMGNAACKAAYAEGEKWLDKLLLYIGGNIEYVDRFINENMPLIKTVRTEGTYLVWIDLRNLALKDQQDFIVNRAGLWLDSGSMFGKAGEGFERINVACPRKTLQEAMRRLKAAYDEIMVLK